MEADLEGENVSGAGVITVPKPVLVPCATRRENEKGNGGKKKENEWEFFLFELPKGTQQQL